MALLSSLVCCPSHFLNKTPLCEIGPQTLCFHVLCIISDTIIPSLPVISIASNNAVSNGIATLGDTITISFRSSEVLLRIPIVEIAFAPAVVVQSLSGSCHNQFFSWLPDFFSRSEFLYCHTITFDSRCTTSSLPAFNLLS